MKFDVLISIQDTNVYFKILNCFLTNGFDGIYLKNVDHGFISNNTITNNSGYGIFLNKSRNNVILSNNINKNGGGGVLIDNSVNSSLINNTISSGRGIFALSSNSSKLTGNTIFNCGVGVSAMLCLKFTLTGNNIFNCGEGVSAIYCGKVILIGNNISDITTGINIHSYNSHISGNFVSNSKSVGIIVYSRNNTIKNNILQNNGIYFVGSQLLDFLQFSIENNSVNGRPIFYSQDVNGGIVPNGVGQVILVNCTDLIVTAQDLSNASFGLLGIFSQNISIENNIISNNSFTGIDLYNSDNCTISGNSFFKNEYMGIRISSHSSDNKILWNDFIGDNDYYWGISQVRDNGLRNLFSCNYWNNWVSPDDNSDGIVDQEYIIEGESHNSDSRPLVSRNRSPHDLIGLSLLFPNGGNRLNGTVAIRWKPVLNSRMDPCSYSFYLSSDNGTSWNYIFETQKLIPTQCIIELLIFWTTSTSPNGFNYLIKVVAENSEGLQVEDTSDAMFIILNPLPPPSPTVRIFLFLLIVLILLVTLRFYPRRPK